MSSVHAGCVMNYRNPFRIDLRVVDIKYFWLTILINLEIKKHDINCVIFVLYSLDGKEFPQSGPMTGRKR